jgi:hypothetical protein
VHVVTVDFLPERADTYDIEVPGLENFLLAAAVVAHNSGRGTI